MSAISSRTAAKIGRDLDWKALIPFEDVELMMA
jgi:hypothetical protein